MQVGVVLARAGGRCGRCIVTTPTRRTAQRGKEPSRRSADKGRGPGSDGEHGKLRFMIGVERGGGRPCPPSGRTLAEFRREPADPTGADFSQAVVRETAAGTLAVGAPVDLVPS